MNAVKRLTAIALTGAICTAWGPAHAQAPWPSQPIKLVVPNPPGGLPDVLARALSDSLKNKLGQPMIVENRPGAGAAIGAAAVASSKPDGYTFLVSDSAVINISHHLNATLPFDRKDLLPVSLIVKGALFIASGPNIPLSTFKEMVDHVKANPGKVSYGTIGVGSFHHLTMEAVQAEAGLKLNHIPYKGSGESVTALRAGHIDLVVSAYAALAPVVKAGQARMIVQNTLVRSKQAPDVPTIAETLPGFELGNNQSLYARSGTPPEVVNKMAAVIAEVVKEPGVIERLSALGVEPAALGPADLRKFLDDEGVRIKKVVDAAGIKPN